jgi:hypothetical protein
VKLIEQTRIYPLGKEDSAKPMQFPDASGVPANMLFPSDGTRRAQSMSAFRGKADIARTSLEVCF